MHLLLVLALAAPLHWSGKMAPGTTLRVLNVHGSIRVTPATGDEAVVDGQTVGANDDRYPVVLEATPDGRDMTICIYRRGGGDRCEEGNMNSDNDDGDRRRADVTVELPRGVRIVASSGNGPVDVTDAGADVTASSGNGRVTVTGAAGRVTARTGNGRVEVNTAVGPVNASSGNGEIDVSMARLSDVADMHFETGNGTITVTLPASYEGEVDANTGHGAIRSDFSLQVVGRLSPEHVHATIGNGGGGRLRLETGNGDLLLRKG
jgi:hypothetical protein